MKRITLGFSILAFSTAFVFSCKTEKDVEPTPDTEVQSAVYASYATYLVSDIDMICSFLGEDKKDKTFYSMYPGTTQTVITVRDTSGTVDQLVMAWNATRCMDGNLRDGSVFMYVDQIQNKRYSRDFGWIGKIRFENYKVNGWKIQTFDSGAFVYMSNTLPSANYDQTATKLTWKFEGKLKISHPTDPKKNMVWDGVLNKTLENSTDVQVFPKGKQTAINWFKAVVSYSGRVKGSGPQIDADGNVTPNVDYAVQINPETPLVRDFQCSPDKISGIAFTNTLNVLEYRGDEHHPFVRGIASFTPGTNYPRQIYFGNEGEPQLAPQCDNTGEVMIKGISYSINFFK